MYAKDEAIACGVQRFRRRPPPQPGTCSRAVPCLEGGPWLHTLCPATRSVASSPLSGCSYFLLTERQLEIVNSEVANLLVRSKWHISAAYFDARGALLAPATLPPAVRRKQRAPQGKLPFHPGQYL